MRVLYFSRDYTTHDHRFLNALAKSDHEVFFLRLERQNWQLEDRPLPEGVQMVLWEGGQEPAKFAKGLVFYKGLKKVLKEINPDLVHAGPIQKCAFLTALAGFKPLISMSWGSDILKDADRNIFWRMTTRYTLSKSSYLIGDCQAVKEKAKSFGMNDEKITLFPWGIDLKRFKPGENKTLRERNNWQDAFVVLSLRSWEPVYGVDVLVKAFVLAAKEDPTLRLILLGGGSQAGLLRSILKNNHLMDRVHFSGQVNQESLAGYYHASDLYVSASHSDGSSVSLMEALGCGMPVLVSDIPGNKEWISDGKEGWLFPDGNVKLLAEKMLYASANRDQLCDIEINSRNLAEQRADWDKNSAKLLDVYAQALASL
ncbi:MAG: glycosyltransferase [Anaerolineaceae bacterium]|nr:glycosyltransferase [Anaerolineaceae bacterium]